MKKKKVREREKEIERRQPFRENKNKTNKTVSLKAFYFI